MKNLKLKLSILIFTVVTLMVMMSTAFAMEEPTVVARGGCGAKDNEIGISWTIDSDGVMTLIGSGEMENYRKSSGSSSTAPWLGYRMRVYRIVMDNRITTVGNCAFAGFENLAGIEISEGLTRIGYSAFEDCINLNLTALPNGITDIGDSAFFRCVNLAPNRLPDELVNIGNSAFDGCKNLALTKLPDGLMNIGARAFVACENLDLTELPEKLEKIGAGAFQGIENLTLTELPESVTYIGGGAFRYCKNLALTKLPKGLTCIETGTFSGCQNLALTELPEGITRIGDNAFQDCISMRLTELPRNLTQIGIAAFYDCTSLVLTELPAGLSKIEMSAFKGCYRLALTELPEGITKIDDYAFSGCTNLALTKLPEGLTRVGKEAFLNCKNTAFTKTPEKLYSFGERAFYCTRWRIATEHYVPNGQGEYTVKETTSYYIELPSGNWSEADTQDYSTEGYRPIRHDNEFLGGPLSGARFFSDEYILRRYYDYAPVEVTINDDQGGSTTQEVPYGGKATEPELEERPGYKLVWVTEDGEHFDFETPITEPITISPVWAPVGGIHGVVVDNQGKPVPDAHIAIVAGNTNYFETDADANGHFWIYNVPYGSYDMVTTKRALTVTSLFELDHTLEEVTVTLPDAQTNSVLLVNQGTKDVVVGGLDELFTSEIYNEADQTTVADGGSVTVQMMVKAVTEEEIPESAQDLNAAAAADGKTIFGYMEMDVSKITETAAGETTEENIPELPQLLQIIDPLSEEQKGKTGYAVYRMHGGHVYTITETPNENGAYITVSGDTLTIFASKFSEYCLAFDTPAKPDEGEEKPAPIIPPDDSSDDDDDDSGRRNPFIDVKPDDWFYDDVLDAYDAGYMEGITSNTFRPDASLTRAQAAYTFAKVAKAELKGLEITSDFEDVTGRTVYADAITWANDAGVEIGYGNGKFGPADSLTREQLALMLYRTYGNGEEILTWEGDFLDLEDVSDWSEEAVRWAVHAGLLEGTDAGKLLPQGAVTRAEAAALIMRLVTTNGR